MKRLALASKVGLIVGLLAAGAACKDKAPDPAPTEAPVEITGLAAVPASVRVVLGIDVEAISGSWLVKRAVEQMFARDPGLEARIAQLVDTCGVDPGADLRHLIIALGSGPAEGEALMVATGVFSESQISSCIEKSMAADGGSLTTSQVGGRTIYHASGRDDRVDSLWLAFGDMSTLVAATSQPVLELALGDGPKVGQAEPMASWIKRASEQASVWAAGEVDSQIGADLVALTGGQISAPPKALYGHIWLKNGLSFQLAAVTASPDDAQVLMTQATAQLRVGALALQRYGLGPVVSKLEASADGDLMQLRFHLTEDELRDVLAKLDTTTGEDQADTEPGAEPSADQPGTDSGDAAGNAAGDRPSEP